MTARTIDTNVLVRLLVDDHSEQAAVAADLAKRFQLVVLPTVMLETEWVLRSRFSLARPRIVELLQSVIDFEGFVVIEGERIARAISGFANGMDFADAIHICFVTDGDTFTTFDRELVKLARRHIDTVTVELAQ
jgi:predicted nucleic-acid-binding protein